MAVIGMLWIFRPMNQMGNGILLNERGQSLVDAAYRALGYRDDTAGYWRR